MTVSHPPLVAHPLGPEDIPDVKPGEDTMGLSDDDYSCMLDDLAELEHIQWMTWSMTVAKEEPISADRIARWKRFWVEYDELGLLDQERDRYYAREVLKVVRRYLGQ